MALTKITKTGITDAAVEKAKVGADAIDATKIEDDAISEEHLDVTAITGNAELSAVAADDDVLLVYDTSATAVRKIQKSNIVTLTYTSGTATGDGSDTTFTINSGRSVNDVLVIVNGAILIPTTDYTISGTTLTFLTAPAADAEISIRYLPI